MLDDLINYLEVYNNESLLARIYGVFTIKTFAFAPVDVIIMQNTVNLSDKKNQTMTFDLKGSMINRKVNFSDDEYKWWVPRGKEK